MLKDEFNKMVVDRDPKTITKKINDFVDHHISCWAEECYNEIISEMKKKVEKGDYITNADGSHLVCGNYLLCELGAFDINYVKRDVFCEKGYVAKIDKESQQLIASLRGLGMHYDVSGMEIGHFINRDDKNFYFGNRGKIINRFGGESYPELEDIKLLMNPTRDYEIKQVVEEVKGLFKVKEKVYSYEQYYMQITGAGVRFLKKLHKLAEKENIKFYYGITQTRDCKLSMKNKSDVPLDRYPISSDRKQRNFLFIEYEFLF